MKNWQKLSTADFFNPSDTTFESQFDGFVNWRDEIEADQAYVYHYPLESYAGPETCAQDAVLGGSAPVINFSSYNYFGLGQNSEVREAAKQAVDQYGLGAGGSPILSGTYDVHHRLEKALNDFFRSEASALFTSGYTANVGTLSAILRPGDLAIMDRLVHASLIDGVSLSKADVRYFKHNDVDHLERILKSSPQPRKIVVVDALYSMDGDFAPLDKITEVAKKHQALIYVDEAHSSLVFGRDGRGLCEHFGVEDAVDLRLGAFSKTLGSTGGFLLGRKKIMQYVKHYARSRLFSCNLPPVMAAAALKALEAHKNNPGLRIRLEKNADFMRLELVKLNLDIGDSESQIIPVFIKDDSKAFYVSRKLFERGVFVQPAVFPAVKKHSARLRLSVTSEHSFDQMKKGAQLIREVFNELGL